MRAVLVLAIFTGVGLFAPARASSHAAGGRAGLLTALASKAPALNPRVLDLATRALRCVRRQEPVKTLSVIDYSLPSTERRLWVFDLGKRQLLFREWVAHGRNTGGNMARHFSNRPGSLMSSLGTFVTDGTYVGHNGLSLRLKGLDGRFNNEAEKRAIVMHGADYVSRSFARHQGRLGRSWGCPALRRKVAPKIIHALSKDAMVFAYYPDRDWLRGSRLLHGCGDVADAGASGSPTAAAAP
jgi:hypothetical protein